jgi:hypothetical protein
MLLALCGINDHSDELTKATYPYTSNFREALDCCLDIVRIRKFNYILGLSAGMPQREQGTIKQGSAPTDISIL